MAHPQIAVFARLADQNAKPVRKIEGQKTLLGRTMHAIAYDEIHDEFVVPQQFAQAILTFRGDANGEVPPIRVIQGSNTRLEAPDRLAVDAVHNEIYVPEGHVLVFDRRANGNVAPIRVIESKEARMNAGAVAADPLNDLIIVSTGGGFGSGGGGTRFLVFDRMSSGDTKPKLSLSGPRSLGGPFSVYPPKKLIIATNRPTGEHLSGPDSYLGIWSYEKGGDNPPLWRIAGPNGILEMPRGTTLDVKNKSIIMSDKRLNSVLTFYFPEMF
ncbi:MAG TPA: hypothetical protein VNN17_05875 [Terriglobia bacterium]|nr:hypothetical protein [Terriglobia bacterium]